MTYNIDPILQQGLGKLYQDQLSGSFTTIVLAISVAGGLYVSYKLISIFLDWVGFKEVDPIVQRSAESAAKSEYLVSQANERYQQTLRSHPSDPFATPRARLDRGEISIEDYRDLANGKPLGYYRQLEESKGLEIVKNL